MPPSKRRKLGEDAETVPVQSLDNESDEDVDMNDDGGDAQEWSTDEEGDEEMMTGSAASSPDTENEIANAMRKKKSKKTAKRKFRATEPGQFGNTLEALLNTSVPGVSAAPLALKPSINKRKKKEKNEMIARKAHEGEKKEHEEIGRITDVIGGWGGENERALRKVAQRGVVQLFNVIQKAQATKASEETGKLALRGSGKPTLEAPKMHSKNKKTSQIARKEDTVDKDDFMNAIRSGGVVSRV